MTPRIGLALGSGSARGWAHIAVIRALEEQGIRPDVVAGTSIGALVGGAYAAGGLDDLEEWVLSLGWQDVLGFMDWSFDGGLISGKKLIDYMRGRFSDVDIASASLDYAAVATDLERGSEYWLQEGPMLDAIRASIALPGLFSPVKHEGRMLVDGGLVNPVPVSLCRAMGADLVIAVDLNGDLLERHRIRGVGEEGVEEVEGFLQRIWQQIHSGEGKESLPSIAEVLTRSINIMAMRITRSRMAGDPPDLLIQPRLGDIGLMEFHRAGYAMEGGREVVESMRPQLQRFLKN